jgi:hypothetical protein
VPKDLCKHKKRKEVIYRKKEMDRRVPDPKTQTKGGNLP